MARYAKPTRYILKNPSKYVGNPNNITMRSTWERRFAIWCDTNPNVLQWNSEGMAIPYYSQIDGKERRYFIDFFVKVKKVDGSVVHLAVEVKPYKETQPPALPKRKTNKTEARYLEEMATYQRNSDKWSYAREWCKRNGFTFIIMTEHELGIA